MIANVKTVVVYISQSTGLPFAVLRQRVPLHLSGWDVKKLIAAAGEFLWLPSEYELFHSKRDFLIYDRSRSKG